jgi:hypothetical protein
LPARRALDRLAPPRFAEVRFIDERFVDERFADERPPFLALLRRFAVERARLEPPRLRAELLFPRFIELRRDPPARFLARADFFRPDDFFLVAICSLLGCGAGQMIAKSRRTPKSPRLLCRGPANNMKLPSGLEYSCLA